MIGRNYASSTSSTFGAYAYCFRSLSSPASTSYALYATNTGNATTEYAGYFSGDVYTTGSYLPSDAILKTEVDVFEGGLEQLAQLETKVYEYKTNEYPHFNFPEGQQIGLMAENLKEVFPQLVKASHQPEVIVPLEDAIDMGADYTLLDDDDDMVKIADGLDFDVVNYTGLIPVLVNSIQEQQVQIEEKDELTEEILAENAALRSEVDQLKDQMAQVMEMLTHVDNSMGNCCGTYKEFEPSNQQVPTREKAELMQNIPNPFGSSTLIKFFLPEHAGQASLHFYDVSGVELSAKVLGAKGHSQVIFNDSQLPSGTYFYSLVVDGEVLDTKRMILLK